MPVASKLAFVLFCAACAVSASIIATTPDGDIDSHAFMLAQFLLVALPLGLALGTTGVVQSYRRHTRVASSWVALLLFVAPIVFFACLLEGWL
ncbi:MAG TPA: hypothetical protein VN380_22740 [Thermoanaerobaculia bacterium]|jgi:hypothetical protein|nr:hypothetical protein [Thermoanaerobaculia bacterium]